MKSHEGANARRHEGKGKAKRQQSRFQLDGLRNSIKPFRLHFFPRLRSTNDHAAVLRKQGKLFAPAIVLTPHQIAGRGRGSNTWFSAAGSLTVTFVLPVDETCHPHQLPLAAGLAIRNAIAELTACDDIALKWPNDLLYENRKLAGLLCERTGNIDLIGIGLNINLDPARAPKSICTRLTSMLEITGQSFDMNQVLSTIAQFLYRALARDTDRPFPNLLKEYDRHHALVGRRITVAVSPNEIITGTCRGLDSIGRLLVRNGSTVHRIIAGQIESF